MSAMLFRPVLSSALRMAFPLGLALLLVPVGRKSIRPRTLLAIQKLMMSGMLLALILAFLGPLVRVPISYQLAVTESIPQTAPSTPIVVLTEPPPLETEAAEPVPDTTADMLSPPPANIQSTHITFPAFSLRKALGALWLCGAAAQLALTFTQNARFLQNIRRDSFPALSDLSQLELSCSSAIGLRTPPAVMIAPAVSSPMAAGCLHPVIYLPARVLLLPEEQQRLLLTHELYHCKARDNLWRVFCSVLLAIYWFDPLIWALAYSFSTQCELCCDDNVLSCAPVQTRKLYGGLLLSFATKTPAPLPVPSLQSGWKESFRAFKLRIGQIVSQEKKVAGTVVLAVCCLIFVLFSGMMSRETFNPSEVFYLPRNDWGISWGGLAAPRKTFPILPPMETDQVYRDTGFAEGHIIYDHLFFFAKTEHEPVVAGCDGLVVLTYEEVDYGYGSFWAYFIELGTFVIIDCGDGISLRYTNLDSIQVEEGQWVRAGDVIGTAGTTGFSYGDNDACNIYITQNGLEDQCGVYVLQDGLMVNPMLFFDVPAMPYGFLTGIPWEGAGYSWIDEEEDYDPEDYDLEGYDPEEYDTP